MDIFMRVVLFLKLFVRSAYADTNDSRILALQLINSDDKSYYTNKGQITIKYGMNVDIQVIGINLEEHTGIYLTSAKSKFGGLCDLGNVSSHLIGLAETGVVHKYVLRLNTKDFYINTETYYVCLRANNTYIHQGMGYEVSIQVRPDVEFLPWRNYVCLGILLCLSGLFSGLNLGLMSLDLTQLQVIARTGTETERDNAKIVFPIRICGNFLLCSILLGNVLVNTLIAIIFDNIPGANGPKAVIGSTIGIVVFGEIVPQAICSRYGLSVGGKTILITKLLMLLTCPFA